MQLLADIGGTNARFALARRGRIDPASIVTLRSDTFPTFQGALIAFLNRMPKRAISAACVAIAGPVSDGSGHLTNRDWWVNAADIGGAAECSTVRLINDLYALGRALPALGAEDLSVLLAVEGRGNDQMLVVNIGTGFNTGLVMKTPTGVVCAQAEAGHVSLPTRVADRLARLIGAGAADFATVEHCFSGRGLSAVHAAATAGAAIDGAQIIARAREGDSAARRTMTAYADMLGLLLCDLNLMFLPGGGIYLAGGVARAVLSSPFGAAVGAAFAATKSDSVKVGHPPVSLILSDHAGLIGCLAVLND